MRRRALLGSLAAVPLLLGSRIARAENRTRLKGLSRDARGTTLLLALDHAPFAGLGYHDDTVVVFVPAHFRWREQDGISVLAHFHGHNTTAERAMAAHELREQVADSKQNALLVIPQLAVLAADSSCGR